MQQQQQSCASLPLMRFFAAVPVVVVALLPSFASAFINGIVSLKGSYKADETTSTFPVTFSTGSTKVEFFDLAVSFGLSTPAEHTVNNTLGNPLFNADLLAMRRSSTGPGQLTIQVPISNSDLYNGAGTYVLTAAVLRATGNQNAYLFRADPFTITFNATLS
ncbi:hypothetical protein EXIGLDRAFT_721135 [Exidia glandulosa HHB12029]|uniref:Uncharacterized protein n=1 Tax=Exidia glandulosa HHB12029 TaxID=1314781 RepID=A0A165FWM9_EXIGL|nr:hypothetical protein EXIGLDRAFT_721135 [Exidia glandulosa HHB12029]